MINWSAQKLADEILKGNRIALSKSITLVESTLEEHRKKAAKIVEICLSKPKETIRIGISGVPGVGKSTFIESFGNYLIEKGNKVAVLAVDPSSTITKGSILGDKTRMETLSRNQNAYIRPSPSSGVLGGVAAATREALILCEAAGFNIILIETVGVGQSEIAVKSMVDFYLLLMLAGAGDELQGIKRGIMEMADAILINKADEENIDLAKRAKATYKNALHLFPASDSEWIPQVELCSALHHQGMDKAFEIVEKYVRQTKGNGFFDKNRQNQSVFWMYESIENELKKSFYNSSEIKVRLKNFEKELKSNQISSLNAAAQLLDIFFKKSR
jgi:LAO/AO transport system kinase